MPKVITLLAALAWSTSIAGAQAQLFEANPYAGDEARAPGRWPPYYKETDEDATHALMYAMGWCKPGGWRSREFYAKKYVDVNALPEGTFQGLFATAAPGSIAARDEAQQPYQIMIYPDASISSVTVRGSASPEALTRGQYVRLVGIPDASGRVAQPVERIELTTADRIRPEAVKVGSQSRIIGRVVGHSGKQVQVAIERGKLRKVTFDMADDCRITVNGSEYRWAQAGDPMTGKGKVFIPDYGAKRTMLFASELTITLSKPLDAESTAPASKHASK